MDIWRVRKCRALEGACFVQGSKNASLPIIAAAAVYPVKTVLTNVPRLRDVDAALRILRHLGCRAEQQGGSVRIDSAGLDRCTVPKSLMEEMRSSVIFMGALTARCGEAHLSLPGGCQLGKRPIDLHLSALRQMGAEIEENGCEIELRAKSLHGADITLRFPSVGATENIMLAACGAEGETLIRGAAREPEIEALGEYLNSAGAHITGAGTDTVHISGMGTPRDARCRIVPDRIAAATLECACAAVSGDVELRGIDPRQLSTVSDFLKHAGCDILYGESSLRVISDGRLHGVGEIVTAPYPGFPTDAQPVLMAALLKAEGVSRIRETIFENRYRQVPELRRLGAEIEVSGKLAEIRGVERLRGTTLTASDLRGGAAMLIAGLCAEGETRVLDDGHICRGYESFDSCLRSLGADVWLEK